MIRIHLLVLVRLTKKLMKHVKKKIINNAEKRKK